MFKLKPFVILSFTLSISTTFASKASDDEFDMELLRLGIEASRLEAERASEQTPSFDPDEAHLQEALRLSLLTSQPMSPEQQRLPNTNDHDRAVRLQLELDQQYMREKAQQAFAEQFERELNAQSATYAEANNNAINYDSVPIANAVYPPVPILPIVNFIPAIGEVKVIYSPEASHNGTGTLIEPNIVMSAAHVFHKVLPAAKALRQKTGPVFINLRGRHVSWKNAPVRSMVVDAKYIHLLHELDGHNHTEEITRYDVACLMLEVSMPANHPTIPLIGRVNNFYQMCVLYGYGKLENAPAPGLHHIAMKLDVDPEMIEHDVIRLDAEDNLPSRLLEGRKELFYLVCKPKLEEKDIFVSESPPGDSGGPMLVVTPEGVRIAGVMCAFEEVHIKNWCTTLFTGNQRAGYALSAWVPAMLSFLKRGL